ncbi:hypothetical protein THAOC_24615, partial [Thalassiosira oceanica]
MVVAASYGGLCIGEDARSIQRRGSLAGGLMGTTARLLETRSSPWEANRRRNPPNTPNNMSAEDDDLYGDLATVTVKPATTSQLTFASKQ